MISKSRGFIIWFCYAGIFAVISILMGLVAACFVPADWVVVNKDVYYRQLNPHSVVDLADDYAKRLSITQMRPVQHEFWQQKQREMWWSFWLRWGLVSITIGIIALAVHRTMGRQGVIGLSFIVGIGSIVIIGIYLVTHPGFNPLI